MYTDFKDKAVFLAVYLAEAHASDEWPVGPSVSFCKQPKQLSERCALAQKFESEHALGIPMFVDSIENSFDGAFAAWPLRFYVIKDGRLALKAQPNLEYFTYDPDDLHHWLQANCA